MTRKLQIVVADRGWVYIGYVEKTDDGIHIAEAKSIRRWGTSSGLGQLALSGPQDATKLDEYGSVHVPDRAIVSLIDVHATSAWAAHFSASAVAA